MRHFIFCVVVVAMVTGTMGRNVGGIHDRVKRQADGSCELADIILVLDSSGSIGADNWPLVLNFTASIVAVFLIGPDNVRIGVNSFGNMASVEFNLNEYDNVDDVIEAIWDIQWKNYNTNTSGGIRLMHRDMFTAESGARDDVVRIGIVITDGVSTYDTHLTVPEADIARTKDIILFAIGIGLAVNPEELRGIGNKPSDEFVFQVDDFDTLDAIKDAVIGRACEVATGDIDECDTNNGGCAQHCTNTQGSYSCGCDDGYLFNGMECNDIDECSSYNGGCEHHCNNTMGSFHCTCSPGYQRVGTKCTDIDECARDNGGCDQQCHNTAGSHLCRCRVGYQQEAGVCTDIDECRDSPCEQSCHNVDGGFYCYCGPGWAIMEDNVTCTECQKCDSRYSNTTPIWAYIVIGLLGAVVIAMAVVIFMMWRRRVGANDTNTPASTSRPLDLHPGSERAVPASPAAVSREDRPIDPEVSGAPADSQYEQIKLYTNSEAGQGVYEKVA